MANTENNQTRITLGNFNVNSNASNSNASNSNEDSKFIVQIRDQLFYIEVWIYNQLLGFEPVAIPLYYIETLCIDESLYKWNSSGSITLLNDFEILERGSLSYIDGKNDSPQINASFLFRSDGRNKISIKIKPLNFTETLPQEQWEMSYDFIVYDIEDIETETSGKKFKKLNFVDERYQILLERNIQWSTSDNEYQKVGINATDDQRALSVSSSLKSIISTAASNSSNPSSPTINIGSKKGPKGLDSPDYPMANFDDNDWDAGSSDSKVLYTSTSQSNALDDIDYVFKSLKASDGSPCFLSLDRYDREGGKQWHLTSLSNILKKSSENQVERLIVEDSQDPIHTLPYLNRAPFNPNESSNIKNFQSAIASRILSYELIPMATSDDFAMTNEPIHNFNFKDGQYNIFFEGNTVKDLLTNMKETAKGLYAFDNSNQLLLNINKTKSKGLMVNNSFVPRAYFPENMSYVHMAKKFLLLNQAIKFSTLGLTLRSPGKFVFIDKDTSTGEKNPFDDKALGQWLIINISHIFTKDTYVNEVIATKIDSYNKWFDELDDTGGESINY
jgi:hypothetical protein